MKNVFKIIVVCFLWIFIFKLYGEEPESERYKAKEAFRRLMEAAHPTPDNQYFEKFYWDMLQGTRIPYFLNIDMTLDEPGEENRMQNESSIAYNPTDPTNLIGSAVDYRDNSSTWVYVSWDGENMGQ